MNNSCSGRRFSDNSNVKDQSLCVINNVIFDIVGFCLVISPVFGCHRGHHLNALSLLRQPPGGGQTLYKHMHSLTSNAGPPKHHCRKRANQLTKTKKENFSDFTTKPLILKLSFCLPLLPFPSASPVAAAKLHKDFPTHSSYHPLLSFLSSKLLSSFGLARPDVPVFAETAKGKTANHQSSFCQETFDTERPKLASPLFS